MKKLIIIILFTLFTFLQFSCNDSDSILIGNPDGVFSGKISLYDSSRANPITGRITFRQSGSNDLKGNWSFDNGENGNLVGTIDDMKVNINLNPNFIDNNTILLGIFDGEIIKGEWQHIGFIGVINHGTFVASPY